VTATQIVGSFIALAGVAWVFIHPGAKWEGEASYASITFKSLTQGCVIVIIGAGLIYLGKGDDDGELTLSQWATRANEICDQGYEEMRALNVSPDPEAQFRALPQMTQISTDINQKLQVIGRPSGAEARVDQLLSLASQSNVEARRSFSAWASGGTTIAQEALSEAQRLGAEVQSLDGELGANACALGP
jgi:hypothetical protein